jgi:putative acetyltransferase
MCPNDHHRQEGHQRMSVMIRTETAADREAVYQVHRLAFGREDESRLVEALQAGGYARVSLIAEADGELVGHVLFSELRIHTEGGVFPALSLTPLAVIPRHQRRGVGSALVRRGLELGREAGHRAVIVLGHAAYYPRFRFSAALGAPLTSPFSGRSSYIAAELVPGALRGVAGRVVYPEPLRLA